MRRFLKYFVDYLLDIIIFTESALIVFLLFR